MPQGDVLKTDDRVRTHRPGHPADTFGEDRVSLVRHRRRAFLTLLKRILGFSHLGPLPMPHVGGEPLDAGGDDGERTEVRRVPVARHDLRRNGFGRKAERREGARFERGREVRVGTDGSRDLANGAAATVVMRSLEPPTAPIAPLPNAIAPTPAVPSGK